MIDGDKIIQELRYMVLDGEYHTVSERENIATNILVMLKEQDELIKAMKRDLDLVRSCKVCRNWTECSPDASPESPEFKMWRDCGGSCKLNWKWRGI